MKTTKETEGEDLIADFLEEKSIEFERYKKINNLNNDDKTFREADFYLPTYKVYIEFLGQWNNPGEKERYKKKMSVYTKNKIPCIYLWPDNLGTLDWMFKRRMRATLLKYNKKSTLLRYEFKNYFEKNGMIILIFGILIYYAEGINLIGISILFLLWVWFITLKPEINKLKKIKKTKWVSGNYKNV